MKSREEVLELQAREMTEAKLQASVLALVAAHGFLVYHTYDSRRSQPGFPDLVILNTKTRKVMYRELKSHKGKIRPEQQVWLAELARYGQDVDVWRPLNLLDGTIARQLAGHR